MVESNMKGEEDDFEVTITSPLDISFYRCCGRWPCQLSYGVMAI
jgi:hypothetical protein